MKITVNLKHYEVEGIKAYLTDLGENCTKQDIEQFINGIVETTLQNQHEAVGDYIKDKFKNLQENQITN